MGILTAIFLTLSVLLSSGLILCFFRLRAVKSHYGTVETQSEAKHAEIAKLQTSNQALLAKREAITDRFKSIIDIEREKSKITAEMESSKSRLLSDAAQIENDHRQNLDVFLRNERQAADQLRILQENIIKIREEITLLDEVSTMQSFGFYTPRYGFESSRRYQLEIDRIRGQQKAMIVGKRRRFL